MNDDTNGEGEPNREPNAGDRGDDAGSGGTEIPISTGDDPGGTDPSAEAASDEPAGDEPTADETAAGDDGNGGPADETSEDGVGIDVEVGPPGPRVEGRSGGDGVGSGAFGDPRSEGRERGPGGAGGGLVERLDESIVSALSRTLDTETHVRVYVALRRRPWSTAGALAEETGLYPQTVRDALSGLESLGIVERRGPPGERREANGTSDDGGAGDDGSEAASHDPEYAAVAPSVLLTDAIGDRGRAGPGSGPWLAERLNVDRYLGSASSGEARGVNGSTGTSGAADVGDPVRIDVTDGTDEDGEDGSEGDGAESVDDPEGEEGGDAATGAETAHDDGDDSGSDEDRPRGA